MVSVLFPKLGKQSEHQVGTSGIFPFMFKLRMLDQILYWCKGCRSMDLETFTLVNLDPVHYPACIHTSVPWHWYLSTWGWKCTVWKVQ